MRFYSKLVRLEVKRYGAEHETYIWFLFQTGSIRSSILVMHIIHRLSFYSKLVRLEDIIPFLIDHFSLTKTTFVVAQFIAPLTFITKFEFRIL